MSKLKEKLIFPVKYQ